MSLVNFEKNIKSQYGEDGVITEIFNRLGIKNKVCVEFGAWDGEYLSNCWNLWHNQEWFAYLIEGDETKANALKKTTETFPKTVAIHKFITPGGANSLDNVLSEYPIPKDFDLLSIDIDGNDYYILESLINYRPRLIIIEFNPTVPPYMELVQEKDEYMGASSYSIIKLAKTKGYVPVHITQVNLFLIPEELFLPGRFEPFDNNIQYNNIHLVNVITSFDGIPFLSTPLPYKTRLPNQPETTIKSVAKNIFRKPIVAPEPKCYAAPKLLPVNIFKRKQT